MQTIKLLIVAVWMLLVLVPIIVGLGEDDRWMMLIPVLVVGWVYWYWRSSQDRGMPGTKADLHLSSKPVRTSHDAEYWDEVFRDSDEMAKREFKRVEHISISTAAGDMTGDDLSSARSDVMER